MQLDLNKANILSRIRKFDIYVKGGEGMSKEQIAAFDKLISGREDALATALSHSSSEETAPIKDFYISADEQHEAFEKEFNCKVKFRIGIGHFRINITSNN